MPGTWIEIQVSARILKWPSQCARCFQPADAKLWVEYTRTTGKKVIHTDTKGWDVPYCSQCLRHIQEIQAAETELSLAASHNAAAANMAEKLPHLYAAAAQIDTGCYHVPGIAVLVGISTALVGFLVLWGLGSDGGAMRVILFILGGLLCLAFSAAPVVVAWIFVWPAMVARALEKKAKAIAAAESAEGQAQAAKAHAIKVAQQDEEHARKNQAQAQSLLRSGCCPGEQAVHYDGWSGSIHTFRFFNPKFASEFCKLNASKRLS